MTPDQHQSTAEKHTKARPSKSPYVAHLKFEGRRYRLEKRPPEPDGTWYTAFRIKGRRIHRSLDTNQVDPAISRAITHHIKPAKAGQWEEVDASRLKARSVATVADIFEVYDRVAMIDRQTITNNKGSLIKILTLGLSLSTPDAYAARLDVLGRSLIQSFQEARVREYCAAAGPGQDEQREARERALRSSKSTINQARCLFHRKRGFIERYQQASLTIPECVKEFRDCSVEGRLNKTEYYQPDDTVVKAAFEAVQKLKTTDPLSYTAFWFAAGAGLRRKEIHRMRWEFIIERHGQCWIAGALGKDGKRVEVPMQTKAVEALKDLRKESGPVLGDVKSLEWAKNLNRWLRAMGWTETEKVMHELRAYVGSLLYRQNSQLAMVFLRHKSISITEKFYKRYGPALKPVDVL